MDFAAIRSRAEAIAAPVVDRVQSIRIDPPAVPLSRVLIGSVVALALAAGSMWWIKRERDAWWREKIAASSAVVNAIVAKGGEVAVATDEQIIGGLKDADTQRAKAEADLEAERKRPVDPARDQCRVPAHCLGVRQQ